MLLCGLSFVEINLRNPTILLKLGVSDSSMSFLYLDCTVEPLGMEDGRIKDSQITGSPYWHAPHYGRLHFASKAWVARQQAAGQYLQIDLNKKYSIRKVATQGRPDHDIWTTKYYLSYSQDGSSWESYKDGGIVKV